MLAELLVFAVAFATVALVTPWARQLAFRLGAVAQPDERRVHQRPTAQLGGLALFAGLVVAMAVGSVLPAFRDVFADTSEPQAVLLASLIIVGVGLLDDTRGISAPVKLAGQTLAAGTLALFGVNLTYVYLPPDTVVVLGQDLAALVTIVAVVAMINAVNLADGLDGLAAGIVAIAAGALFVYIQVSRGVAEGLITTDLPSSAGLVLAALIGVCLAFLIYNFNPASIFMGDTGAMLLGLLLAAAGVSAVGGTIQPSRGAFAAFSVPALVPALVLAVPFVDTVWTILRRLRSGRAVFSPDKRHLHHRLVEIGHSQRRAVLIMYYWSGLLAFAGVGVSLLPLSVVAVVLAVGTVLGAAAMIAGRLARARHRAARRTRWFVSSFTRARSDTSKQGSDQRKRSGDRL